MCLPNEWDTLTREERLMELAAVRRHHRTILDAIHEGWVADGEARGPRYKAAVGVYDAHTAEHKAAGLRLRAERTK